MDDMIVLLFFSILILIGILTFLGVRYYMSVDAAKSKTNSTAKKDMAILNDHKDHQEEKLNTDEDFEFAILTA